MGANSDICITPTDCRTVIDTVNLTGCRRHTSNKLAEMQREGKKKKIVHSKDSSNSGKFVCSLQKKRHIFLITE